MLRRREFVASLAAGAAAPLAVGAEKAPVPVIGFLIQPAVFELRINLKTAKELGLTIPPTLGF